MAKINDIGLKKSDYSGAPNTLCPGCGHTSISNQIVSAAFELNLVPEQVMKFSGIGCSSKSPTYFMDRSFGFNSLHGRMPAIASGAMIGDHTLKVIGVSGDGDTANIGMGQFKHIMRRNAPMLYIVENNGVYGLTKGQFSATADLGLSLKHQGINTNMPIDIVMEALGSRATFVARSFAGDAAQVKELIKAGLSHDGIAVIDIISPCVTFNNKGSSMFSFPWAKEHRELLHDFNFIPSFDEISIKEYKKGSDIVVSLHDGSKIVLQKTNSDYDPTDRIEAMRAVQESHKNDVLLTGLIYIDTESKSFTDVIGLTPGKPLNRFTQKDTRPSKEALDEINQSMF
jgi:2-oxoglutarate ferredoxin oxidoreductase subunit beta